jgi:site-specific recombinase XerD
VYAVDLSADYPELDDLLKEWFEVYRPMLPNAARSPFVFLTQKGRQFDTGNLHKAIADEVALHTGKRFYPHLIRSIYATACRDAGEHFEVPSAMLGDRPATVQKYYYKEDIKLQQSRGKDFVARELRRG